MNDTRKKILYVITKSNWGGAQRYVFDLATHLPQDQFEVVVALGGTGTKGALSGRLQTELSAAGIRTIHVRGFMRNMSLIQDFGTLIELVSIFREERPAIVHLNSAKAVGLGALAARIARVPRIVSTAHGWASHEARPFWQRMLISIFERISRMLAHDTIVVCVHDALREKTTTIHNGIEPVPLLSREAARAELGLPLDQYVVGSIGELTRNKNFEMLVRATRRACTLSKSEILLAIIGDGEDRETLIATAKHIGYSGMRLAGALPQASKYLAAFDIFVLPSRKEGLPYVLIEAGFAHLPAIATAVGGTREIIEHGVSGIIVPESDELALAQALAELISDSPLRAQYGEALSVHVRDQFTLARMVSETIARYRA